MTDSPSVALGVAACWGRPLAGAAATGAPGCKSLALPNPSTGLLSTSMFESLIPGFKDMTEEEQQAAIKKFRDGSGLGVGLRTGLFSEVGRHGNGPRGDTLSPANSEHGTGSRARLYVSPTGGRQRCREVPSSSDVTQGDDLHTRDGAALHGATCAGRRIAQASNAVSKDRLGCVPSGSARSSGNRADRHGQRRGSVVEQQLYVIGGVSEPLPVKALRGGRQAAYIELRGQAARVRGQDPVAVRLENMGSSSPAIGSASSGRARCGGATWAGTVGAVLSRLVSLWAGLEGVRVGVCPTSTSDERRHRGGRAHAWSLEVSARDNAAPVRVSSHQRDGLAPSALSNTRTDSTRPQAGS